MVERTESLTLAEYKKAYRKMNARKARIGFIANLAAYVIVNSLLIAVNLMFVPQFMWCAFPLIGWGIGLTMHYTFGVHLFDWTMAKEEAKAERLASS
jgi:hypothetical protein